ncbi:N-acetylneuraminate epimerase [Rubripirellula amarantea]|uniref:N-acetylneuraminate epimerase n=1 Tax=Rubripirellula amarantea TaxID=2527999 RepID=A0A5C5WEB1_9BACT|nr:kelch repeat-containing protein [Rubripirellula amarantea]TWT49158.1 N-acetylneuraminate epimerase [Rubripirellula amarantea]
MLDFVNRWLRCVMVAAICTTFAGNGVEAQETRQWELLDTIGDPQARHEAAFIECDDRFFLLGGRGVKPVDIYDPKTRTWTQGARSPVEIHHFQPVVYNHQILVVGAMTGNYPKENALDKVLIYDPKLDQWKWGAEIPEDRRRGGAGAAVHGDDLYLVSGIQNGHWDGWVTWLDRLDLKTQTWESLADAPRARDHFQCAFIEDKLYVAGGRRSSGVTKQVFDLTIPEVDVYDLQTGTWNTLDEQSNLPIPRAGCFSFAIGRDFFVAGGESTIQREAHAEVQRLDTVTNQWSTDSKFAVGRHGTGVIVWNDALYTCAGSGGRGGGPELDSTEMLELNSEANEGSE